MRTLLFDPVVGRWVSVILASIFSDRPFGLTVACGLAGAGIAFTLQEVVASVTGWVAISFGRFYAPGDRVQLGGIATAARQVSERANEPNDSSAVTKTLAAIAQERINIL